MRQNFILTGSTNHLGGARRAVGIAGDDDVHAIEGLVALHTLSVHVGHALDHAVIADLADCGPGRRSSALAFGTVSGGSVTLNVRNPKLWSPDRPYLYGLDIQILRNGKVVDKVAAYTAKVLNPLWLVKIEHCVSA